MRRRQKIGLLGQIFISAFLPGIITLGVFLPLVFYFAVSTSADVSTTRALFDNYAGAQISRTLAEAGEASLKGLAVDAAASVAEYVKESRKSEAALAGDVSLSVVANRHMYGRGYIGVFAGGGVYMLSHTRADIIGKNLSDLPEFRASTYSSFWKIVNAAIASSNACGFYRFAAEGGMLKNKYMCIVAANATTTDGEPIYVAATTYLDDYDLVGRRLARSLSTRNDTIANELIDRAMSARRDALLASVALFVASLCAAWLLSRRLTAPLAYLASVCERIAGGKFDEPVDQVNGGAEIEELSSTIEEMRISLAAQARLIRGRASGEAESVFDLKQTDGDGKMGA